MAQLTYNQIAPLLNSMYNQITGRTGEGTLPYATYQQLFTTALINNTSNLYDNIETVLARTIYAIRPYSEQMKGLSWGTEKYADVVRKLTPLPVENLDNKEWDINTELKKETANQDFACCTAPVKQAVLATRVSGGNTYSRKWTIFRNQMNAAFTSEQGVADFFGMLMTERANQHNIDKDNEKRALLNNVILALANYYDGDEATSYTMPRIHAMTEYNRETGLALTTATIMQPDNFRAFMIWFASKLEYWRDLMATRTSIFHHNITGKTVERHTPRDKQRFYLNSQFAQYFKNNMAGLHSPSYLSGFGDYESIPYWQSPFDPLTVEGTYAYTDAVGLTQTGATAKVTNVIGLLSDMDAYGLTNVDIWTAPEPYNARYGFQNTWYHDTFKSITDFTENNLLITLD